MAFGITRRELEEWKREAAAGRIAILTHFWIHPRFPGITSVTKVGCCDIEKLRQWAASYGLPPNGIHYRSDYPHYDLFGEMQAYVLQREGRWDQLRRFVSGFKPAPGDMRIQSETLAAVTSRLEAPSWPMKGGRERK